MQLEMSSRDLQSGLMLTHGLTLTLPYPHLKLLAMHAQDDQAGSNFWMQMLRGSLVQLAATREPLLPWLAEEADRAELRSQVTFTTSATVRLSAASSSLRSWGLEVVSGGPSASRTQTMMITCFLQITERPVCDCRRPPMQRFRS